MVRVTPADESIRREVQGSIDSFVRGKTSQPWVIGKIRSSGINKEALKKLFSESHTMNPNNIQLRELEKECKQKGFL